MLARFGRIQVERENERMELEQAIPGRKARARVTSVPAAIARQLGSHEPPLPPLICLVSGLDLPYARKNIKVAFREIRRYCAFHSDSSAAKSS